MKTHKRIGKIASFAIVVGGLVAPLTTIAAPAPEGPVEMQGDGPTVHLCARTDRRAPTGLRNNGRILLRTNCARSEVSIGTVADLAMVAEKRDVFEAIERVDKDGFPDNGRETVRFTGVNVQIVSGEGSTDEDIAKEFSGVGNLIVGYDEGAAKSKSGSHNLVVGKGHEYTSHSAVVAGQFNKVTAPATVALGTANTSSGVSATVTGGNNNRAESMAASVTGGSFNVASGDYATVVSGLMNEASAMWTSASGGRHNVASAEYATASGGAQNIANAEGSAVSGGMSNTAGGVCVADNKVVGACQADSDCSNGSSCVIGPYAVVAGGQDNRAAAWAATVTAGRENHSFAEGSAIHGGTMNRTLGRCEGGDLSLGRACVTDRDCWVYSERHAVCQGGEFSAIGAGSENRTTGWASAVVGGLDQRSSKETSVSPSPGDAPVWEGWWDQ